MTNPRYTLPPLPYPYNALEPCISEQIMVLHHSKHHAAYIANLNAALQTQSNNTSHPPNESDATELQAKISFNAGGHINHTLFWENLAPHASPQTNDAAYPKITAALTQKWGSVETFKEKIQISLVGIRGSGWGWLVCAQDSGALEIVTTKDQETVPEGFKPLLGIDMWEHAYYLQYLNNKAAYVSEVWRVVNWDVVEDRYSRSLDEIYGALYKLKSAL